MNLSSRQALLVSTSVIANLALASVAQAQDVLETVIVTAEKSASDIQKTPVSITAITPESVKASGAVQLYDMLQGVPALDIQKLGTDGRHNYFLRGVGVPGAVPELVDGVVYVTGAARTAGFDTARIEVLRGPQSTL